MKHFGVTLAEAAQAVDRLLPEPGQRDWSVDGALYIALAYAALKRLENLGGIFRVVGKLLVFPALERAWDELVHVRVRLDPALTNETIGRGVKITRTGRVVYESQFSSVAQQRLNGYGQLINPYQQRDIRSGYAERSRSRRSRRVDERKAQ